MLSVLIKKAMQWQKKDKKNPSRRKGHKFMKDLN